MLLEPEEDDEAVEREAEEADQDVVDQHQHPRRGGGDGELDPETRNNLPPLRGHIVGTVTSYNHSLQRISCGGRIPAGKERPPGHNIPADSSLRPSLFNGERETSKVKSDHFCL